MGGRGGGGGGEGQGVPKPVPVLCTTALLQLPRLPQSATLLFSTRADMCVMPAGQEAGSVEYSWLLARLRLVNALIPLH